MNIDSQWQVQSAVAAHLSADSGVTGLLADGVSGIYDHVPRNSEFPYLVIGEMRTRPLGAQDLAGSDILLSIHSWSRYEGAKELRGLMAAVRDALDGADFAVSGHRLVLWTAAKPGWRPTAGRVTASRPSA